MVEITNFYENFFNSVHLLDFVLKSSIIIGVKSE